MDSLKKNTILSFSRIPSIKGMENNDVILITAAGAISGTLIKETYADNDIEGILNTAATNSAIGYRKERGIADNVPLDGNDGFITLKDVTIRNGNTVLRQPFLCVFFDQIIGVSIGKLNTN